MDNAVTPSRRSLIEAVVASTIGTTIEWYDFFLYGTAAALVFPALFFPEFDTFTGQILAFGTFTVGFLARPLGGLAPFQGALLGTQSVRSMMTQSVRGTLKGCADEAQGTSASEHPGRTATFFGPLGSVKRGAFQDF